MKLLDPLNRTTTQMILEEVQQLIALAELYEKKYQYFEALLRYQQARDCTLYVDSDPKITILYEQIDNLQWHKINDKINELEILIELERLQKSKLDAQAKSEKIIQLKQQAWSLFEKTFQRGKFYTENDMEIKNHCLRIYEKVKAESLKCLSN
ncbi:hypothetical protein [Legionella sainthelensi]|uniref:Uncharacterized protein n=1 Tax=Legionella sainthelensi TaxID=28087 RepID=A0A2H5FM94_9GAMM|nr:hypothetical protein [Legionella sainthelensi]AUH72671.1 hypothetical protein CAB17_11875 [Legionella sainthelensi]